MIAVIDRTMIGQLQCVSGTGTETIARHILPLPKIKNKNSSLQDINFLPKSNAVVTRCCLARDRYSDIVKAL